MLKNKPVYLLSSSSLPWLNLLSSGHKAEQTCLVNTVGVSTGEKRFLPAAGCQALQLSLLLCFFFFQEVIVSFSYQPPQPTKPTKPSQPPNHPNHLNHPNHPIHPNHPKFSTAQLVVVKRMYVRSYIRMLVFLYSLFSQS